MADQECPICLEPLATASTPRCTLPCSHSFCSHCALNVLAEAKLRQCERLGHWKQYPLHGASAACPMCRQQAHDSRVVNPPILETVIGARDGLRARRRWWQRPTEQERALSLTIEKYTHPDRQWRRSLRDFWGESSGCTRGCLVVLVLLAAQGVGATVYLAGAHFSLYMTDQFELRGLLAHAAARESRLRPYRATGAPHGRGRRDAAAQTDGGPGCQVHRG